MQILNLRRKAGHVEGLGFDDGGLIGNDFALSSLLWLRKRHFLANGMRVGRSRRLVCGFGDGDFFGLRDSRPGRGGLPGLFFRFLLRGCRLPFARLQSNRNEIRKYGEPGGKG
jgi:hypothetical protein